MKLSTYQELAGRTEKPLEGLSNRLVHAFMGMATEVGEFGTPVKAFHIYGKDLDCTNAAEELGDILWYVALAANALGVNLDDIAAQNIGKLQRRYPEKYTDAAALERADKLPGEL